MKRMYCVLMCLIIMSLLAGCAEDPQKHFDAGDVYYDQGMYAEAIEAYTRAVELKPDWALAHNNLGLTYEKTKAAEMAAREFTEAIRLDPQLAAAHYNLASVYYDRRQFPEVIFSYRRALEIDPDLAEAHYNLGAAYYETKQYDRARTEAMAAQRLGFDASFLLEAIESASR